ncbi:hypothetical protein FDB55_06845 [Clostridium botulinum]|uniref:hypothetical protein n=1 Tax=Clostridium botulinum TaxID=1491 RepID=UPI0013F0963A|nr:hypothetical protein [Clostridium botulinum]MCS6110390.1 hypothetical protein [Clostridium botulinum]NFE13131.1 hypothetical protein [Clostridium botulinum]NFG58173.1 hypothetical protein [Clostridium botulinum]NFL42223.1 hypothetical protein [Clostridium botulinum]NFN21456.1 hypothetical protein [Clostridium botulinum]
MKKLNKLLYLIIVLSFLAIILPIIFLQFNSIKAFVLATFHTRDNAYGYLQFVGSFLGVVATISVTIILQEKQKYQKEQDENKKAALNLYVQLDKAFQKYKEAKNSNLEYKDIKYQKTFTAFGPREIFIDPNYIRDLAQIKPILDDNLYEDIGLGFDAVINSYKAYLKLKNRLDDAEKGRLEELILVKEGCQISDMPNQIKEDLIQQLSNVIKLEVIEHVNIMCRLYDKKYRNVLERLIKLYR